MSHPKEHLQQITKGFLGEAERWDLEPKLATWWRSSSYAEAVKEDATMETQRGRHKFPFQRGFKTLGYISRPDRMEVWKNEGREPTGLVQRCQHSLMQKTGRGE